VFSFLFLPHPFLVFPYSHFFFLLVQKISKVSKNFLKLAKNISKVGKNILKLSKFLESLVCLK